MSLKQSLPISLKQKMKNLKIRPKKFLGQHFLINSEIINKITHTIAQLEPQLLIEVGPGLGALTEKLITLKRPLYLIEQDKDLARFWKSKKELSTLEGDILKVNWTSILAPNSVLVGNLPYQIASRLLIQCSNYPYYFFLKNMVLMFQKEVAERIRAPCGTKDYSILGVISQCFWKINPVVTVGLSDFYPKPKVAGQVLQFSSRKAEGNISSPKNRSLFISFVKFCFAHRRKILLSRLKKQPGGAIFKDLFRQLNISALARSEDLKPKQFMLLFSSLPDKNIFTFK